jgi:hypothetical protein
MAWWIPELARVVVLLTGGVVVQQLIRRHGVGYVDEIFRATPKAGRAFLALADIAYYLIVVAYTLFSVQLEGHGREATAGQVEAGLYSVALLALIIGGLHAFNLLVLPAVGSSLARRSEQATRVVRRKPSTA